MNYSGNLRKMRSELDANGKVDYRMILFDVLEPHAEIELTRKWEPLLRQSQSASSYQAVTLVCQ